MYLYTLYIWIAGGFKKPAGFYICFSETCILIRHIMGFAMFIDFFGTMGFSKGHMHFWSLFAFAGFALGTGAEIILLLEPYFNSDAQTIVAPKPAAKQMLIVNNDDELFQKVQTHKDSRVQVN
jgi:hypothetical protein